MMTTDMMEALQSIGLINVESTLCVKELVDGAYIAYAHSVLSKAAPKYLDLLMLRGE